MTGCQLKFVVDPVAAAADRLAAAHGAQVATVWTTSLRRSVDSGVIIASSTDTHLDFSMRAVEAGKAVFCEKPLDLDLAKARSAASALGADGARLFLGFNRRFDPQFPAAA